MTRQQRLISLLLPGVLLLCMLVGVYLMAWKRFSRSARPAKIVKHTVETPAEDALAYWTEDKMRHAKAAPLPNVKAPERGKQKPRRPARSPRQQQD